MGNKQKQSSKRTPNHKKQIVNTYSVKNESFINPFISMHDWPSHSTTTLRVQIGSSPKSIWKSYQVQDESKTWCTKSCRLVCQTRKKRQKITTNGANVWSKKSRQKTTSKE